MNIGEESEFQEHKESLAQLDKGIKSMTAMLNKHYKGIVNFGVYDNGDIKGIQIGKKSFDDIRERIAILVQPKFSYTTTRKSDESGNVYLVLSVSGSDIPYSFDGRYYTRNVKSDDLMDNAIVRRAVSSGSYDALKETTSPIQEINFGYLMSYFAANGIHVREDKDFYDNYSLLNSDGKFNLLAYLLGDDNQVSMKAVRFNGTDKSSMSELTELGKRSLLLSCQSILDYVKSQDVVRVDLSGGKRIEKPLFDFESFREAWINAVVHNDWLHMIPPSVFIFDDRVEVSSYGSIPFNMSEEEFFGGRSRPINRGMFNIFSVSSFAEQSGHGVPTIVRNYSKSAFDFSSGMVSVTLPFSFVPSQVEARKNVERNLDSIKENPRNILEFLLANPKASLSEASLNTGISLGGVKKIVASLKSKGLLSRKGPKNGGEWSL